VTVRRDAPPPARRRYRTVELATIAVGLLVGLAVAEIWVRVAKPIPRRQMVRGHCLHSVDGVPVWGCESDPSDVRRHNRACAEQHPERTRILFFGSSITYGSSLTANEVFTTALEGRLNELRPAPGFCVLNFAQPGFAFEQKYAVARAEVARYRPALIVWEDWVEWWPYSMIGEAAYGTGDLLVRSDGFIGFGGVPDRLNRLLFLNSRLYEYLAFAFGERVAQSPSLSELDTVSRFVNDRLLQVLRLARSAGAKLVLYLAPPLDRPFNESAAQLPDFHRALLDFARAERLPAYVLQNELADQDYLALRMDACCHYNAAGHRALVPIMTRIVLGEIDARPATPDQDDTSIVGREGRGQ
jgi:hypothetical protein